MLVERGLVASGLVAVACAGETAGASTVAAECPGRNFAWMTGDVEAGALGRAGDATTDCASVATRAGAVCPDMPGTAGPGTVASDTVTAGTVAAGMRAADLPDSWVSIAGIDGAERGDTVGTLNAGVGADSEEIIDAPATGIAVRATSCGEGCRSAWTADTGVRVAATRCSSAPMRGATCGSPARIAGGVFARDARTSDRIGRVAACAGSLRTGSAAAA